MDQSKNSKQLLDELVAKHNQDAIRAKEEGRLVCWSTSVAPQELLETMDITTVYPENHAALVGAKKQSMDYIEKAESRGYSMDTCSYARVNLGYAEVGYSAAGNIPAPDLLFCCTNICNTVIKWYENLAHIYKVPLIMFDTPFCYDTGVNERSIQYMRGQIVSAIKKLEEITGRRFDNDKFRKVMDNSCETAKWWAQACSYGKCTPSPLNGFDMFNYMALVVCMRGKKETAELFRLWAAELAEKAADGIGPWKDQSENYRVFWDGIACWPYLSSTYKILKKNGINVVASGYPKTWSIEYESGDINGMARAYAQLRGNGNMEMAMNEFTTAARDYNLDGVIFHSNRSCKMLDLRQYELMRRFYKKTGVPIIIFDGDQTDPRNFSAAQFETRIQSLGEMMAERKEGIHRV